MKKRLLAMLMVLMLVVSLLPVGALAADGDTVNRIRLMDKNAWGLAAIEKAGYSNEDVLWSNITSIRFFASDGSYTNWGVIPEEAPDCYSHEGYLATDAGTKIIPSNINRIVVKVNFAYKGLDAFDPEYGVTAVFHSADFELGYTEGSAGVREYAEFSLKSDQSYEKDYSVTFYFQPIGSTQWELYDIVYVNARETLGSNMPAEPNYGTQDFVSWQTQTDGGGYTLTSTTVINEDWVVYGTKTTAGGATAYHVMRDSTSYRYNALQDEVADAYNAENGTSYTSGNVQISNIQVNGIDGEHTNPIYHSNGWYDDASHYYIYNVDAYAAESQPQNRNTRIPVSEVTGITLTGTIDGKIFNVTIPKAELSLQEISNPVTSDTIIEIRVRDKLDGITKELVESAEYAPKGVTGVSYPVDGKVTIPEDGSVTLLYKITVTGDQNAEYIVTDDGAAVVSGSLTGTLGTDGVAVIYVTKTFSADDVVDGFLTNSASLSNNNTTLPPDDGNDEDEVEVEVEDEGGEEPEPEEPRDPTEAELRKLAVVLKCVNEDVEHTGDPKTFNLRPTNCTYDIKQVNGQYICTVTPNYDLILERYNEQVAGGHTYADEVGSEKTFTLVWNDEAWDNGNASPITRQVKCDTTELPDNYVAEYHVMNLYGELDIIAAKWEHADYIGFYLNNNTGDFLGRPNEELSQYNGWNDDRSYYTVKNGAYDSEDYMPYTEVDGLHFYYAITPGAAFTYRDIDILVTAPDEKHVSEIYVLFDIHLYDDYNNGYWYDRDGDGKKEHWATPSQGFVSGNGRWKAGSDIILEDLATADGSRPYYEPIHAAVNGRDVVFLGWDVENHETIYEPGDEPDNLITDAFSITGDVLRHCNITPLEVCLYGVYGYAEPATVTIAPANITAYVGGDGYAGVTDGNGNIIGTATTSGLPEPGYHIELSSDVVEWFREHDVSVSGDDDDAAEDLAQYISFVYYDESGNLIRHWDLEYVGVYKITESGLATRYVYSLSNDTIDANHYPVRIEYLDGQNNPISTDGILDMDADTVKGTYTMKIDSGNVIDQSKIVAVLKVGDNELEATTKVDTGTLTVLSTTNKEYTTDLNEDSSSQITADVNDGTTFTVNDSEVTLEPEDVKLLVDSVSNNDDFNAALEDDARDHVSMYNAGTESFYLDLVHADNGNVQVGLDGSLTISWPIPDDAAEGTQFHVVHYFNMDRTTEDADLESYEVKEATVSDGTITFTTTSFSPFVLVYEAEERTPIIPIPDPDDDDDDTEYVPKWLNTEDHFAYIVGYEDGEVKPNNNITRAEVATIFFRLLTDNARARYWSQTNDYSDIAPESWYNNAVSTLSNMGIINGYEDGTFKPNAPITRAEFTAIATRFFDYTAEYDGAFNDVSRSAWYADCVQAAVDMGLVDGYPDGGFHPNSNITRAEAVTIVNRVLNRAPHEDHLLDEDEMNVWPDNVYGAWYYADMQEATNSHDYDWIRVSGERVEEWTEKLPERDWAALEQEWSSAYSG